MIVITKHALNLSIPNPFCMHPHCAQDNKTALTLVKASTIGSTYIGKKVAAAIERASHAWVRELVVVVSKRYGCVREWCASGWMNGSVRDFRVSKWASVWVSRWW